MRICDTQPILDFVECQRMNWIAHLVRRDNDVLVKQLLFEESQTTRAGTSGIPSFLDQFLRNTKSYEITNAQLFQFCRERKIKQEFKNREAVFLPKQNGSSI